MSPDGMRQASHIQVVTNNLYELNTKTPAANGVLDLRLGTSMKESKCQTCLNDKSECVGHYGFIDLEMPCFHIGFFRSIISILQCICKSCSKVLLPSNIREKELPKLKRQNLSYLDKKAHRKRIILMCKKISKCPHCGSFNGNVKKCGLLKIVHAKYPHKKKKKDEWTLEYYKSFESVLPAYRDLPSLINKSQEVLNPVMVHNILSRIPEADFPFLLMDQSFGRPEDLVLKRILAPPTCIRPSVMSEVRNGTTEDDITMRLLDIIQQNNNLLSMAQSGGYMSKYMEVWDFLQLQVALLYNSELTGIPKYTLESTKPSTGVIQRLKGKQGRFRCNLCGKRVDYSGRTVISPDPNLRIDQVGVPIHMAMKLTYPEKVTAHNIERLRKLVASGGHTYPGANAVIKSYNGIKFSLFYGKREVQARDLKEKDVVERHLQDGDLVLFNRQPSLHRLSIQGFFAKVLNHRTLRFNESCCNPFNADFDGDEMNIHVPQTEEARAEAGALMMSKSNIISPRNGEPLIAAIQDFITGAFLLTQKDMFLTRAQAMRLAFSIVEMKVQLPEPAFIKPVELWTGKQIFGLVMRPHKASPVMVNLRTKCSGKRVEKKKKEEYACGKCKEELILKRMEKYIELSDCPDCPDRVSQLEAVVTSDPQEIMCDGCKEVYSKASASSKIDLCPACVDYNKNCRKEEMDPIDNFIVIHNSELLAGTADKGSLGSGSKSSVFYIIFRDYGEQEAADAMFRLARLASFFLMDRGFSIGIGDVTPSWDLLAIKKKLLIQGYKKCDEYIKQCSEGQLQLMPGCTKEETLEGFLLKELSDIREQAADACLKELPSLNAPLVMAVSGSKGSNINISQMIACVGQQAISGYRIPNGFEQRALSHFKRDSKDPFAKGFVANSFFSGLNPIEMFFHTVAGREGLVDTAVKTADTGYLQRRLVKAFEDVHCGYDGTVRNSLQEVIQFVYGSDGLDPMAMECKYVKSKGGKPSDREGAREGHRPMDFGRIFEQICKEQPCKNEPRLTSQQVSQVFTAMQKEDDMWKSHKYPKGREAKVANRPGISGASAPVDMPERARNFGRHIGKYIDALCENLERGYATSDSICKISKVTRTQLLQFFGRCGKKLALAEIDPGTTVGALAAQSIGEPGTQMTLKTFHFAGVASMNITQGVPRIVEIINATANISTPVVRCPLVNCKDEDFARLVKGRMERTFLGDVAECFQEIYTPKDVCVLVKLDLKRIGNLKLEIDVHTIRESIAASKYKIKLPDIDVDGKDCLVIRPSEKYYETDSKIWAIEKLKEDLPKIVIKGIPTVKRAVMQIEEKKGQKQYELIVEGTNLQAIMTVPGVVGPNISSNNIMEIKKTLGIEAARANIIKEMMETMGGHGISVDKRHIMLLADIMCYKGDVMGINRGGMAKMRESALMLASFEKTAEHLFEAAYHGQRDAIVGVSERIILGIPMRLGTGMIDLLDRQQIADIEVRARKQVFDPVQFDLPKPLITAVKERYASAKL